MYTNQMHKELAYLRGYLKGKNFNYAIISLNLAEKMHEGQTRKSGEPYISHPVRIANAIISLGIHDEEVISGALLHDILEDTEVTVDMLLNVYYLPEKIVDIIIRLTKTTIVKQKEIPEMTTDEYYEQMRLCFKTSLIKIADRCHNVSTMYFFDKKKIQRYIKETEDYALPLCSYVSDMCPEYSDYIYTMKYQIESILETIKTLVLECRAVEDVAS
ncbi:HD domain-containing protein [Bacillus mobilis]|uniref:HD domain-containing protein n=1 Tax=Bacillus mobilis TaxID=2026190 RepID=UPI002E1EF396|nr:HD domain-containing protein [Bacillus mobilis]